MTVAWKLRSADFVQRNVAVGNVFTNAEIQKIKQIASNLEVSSPAVGKRGEDKSVRRCQIKWFRPEKDTVWVYQRLVDVIQRVNSQYFNFNLYGIQTLQYTVYDSKDKEFYGPHKDSFIEPADNLARKLTFSIQLSDPSEYEGGDLVIDIFDNPQNGSKVFGDTVFFLSDSVHEAKPVTKGVRHVLVGWVVGPPAV